MQVLKNSRSWLILLLVAFFCDCKNDNKSIEKNNISIDIVKKSEVSLFDIFSRIEIINLEINDSAIVKSINKLLVYKNNFYLLDFFSAKIFSFNENGFFNYKIDNKGQGPGEYVDISDFDINNDSLSLLSSSDGKIHMYDLQGHFIRIHRLPQNKGNYENIRYLNNDTIAFWTFDYNNRLKFYSKSSNKIFNESIPQEDNIFSSFSTPVFPYSHYFVRTFDNRVMQMSANGELTLAYEWNFGALNNDVSHFKKALNSNDANSHQNLYEFARKIYSSEIVNYFFGMAGGNSRYLYTQIMRRNKNVSIFFDKETKHNYVFEKTIEGANIFPFFWTEDYVIGIVPQIKELSMDDIIPDNILDDKNRAIKMRINEFDNPILIKYYFK